MGQLWGWGGGETGSNNGAAKRLGCYGALWEWGGGGGGITVHQCDWRGVGLQVWGCMGFQWDLGGAMDPYGDCGIKVLMGSVRDCGTSVGQGRLRSSSGAGGSHGSGNGSPRLVLVAPRRAALGTPLGLLVAAAGPVTGTVTAWPEGSRGAGPCALPTAFSLTSHNDFNQLLHIEVQGHGGTGGMGALGDILVEHKGSGTFSISLYVPMSPPCSPMSPVSPVSPTVLPIFHVPPYPSISPLPCPHSPPRPHVPCIPPCLPSVPMSSAGHPGAG